MDSVVRDGGGDAESVQRLGRLREHVELVLELHVYPQSWTDHERAVSIACLGDWLADTDPRFCALTYAATHDVIASVLADHNGSDAVLQREVVDATLAKLAAASARTSPEQSTPA